jgi:hypothetical protein
MPSQHWRYKTVLSIPEAKVLPSEELLVRTNPGLAERLRLKDQICALGGDAGFAVAYEQLESMRPGALRSKLLTQLLDWKGMTQKEQPLLGQHIATQVHAWQFACQVAPGFPDHAGSLVAALVALCVWSAFLWLPATHSWLWGSITLFAGLAAAGFTRHLLLRRKVCQWTRKILIPEAQDANVCLKSLLAVVDDVPGSRLAMMEELWPVKVELETIRRVLSAEQKL